MQSKYLIKTYFERHTHTIIMAIDRLRGITIALLFCCLSLAGSGQAPGFVHLAPDARIAEDTAGAWTAGEVAEGLYYDAFSTLTEPIPNLGFTTSTYWLRVDIPTTVPGLFYLECARPVTNAVDCYLLNDSGHIVQHLASGDDLPFHRRPINHRRILFPIATADSGVTHLLVRMQSDGEVLTASLKLWEVMAFLAFTQQEDLFLGIYYGLLLFVLIIFGFFALALKQRIYTLYIMYILGLLLMQASLDGTAFRHLWPDSSWMANHSVLLFSSLSVMAMMLYAGAFLRLREMPLSYTRGYYVLGAIVGLCIITSLTSGWSYEWTFPVINATSFVVLLVIIAGIAWKTASGKHVSLAFALAFISVLVGGLLFISTNLGLFFNEFLSNNAIKLGSAAEVIFLSLAMAARYRDVQREKEIAQKEAYEHLQAINLITKNQKQRLEEVVVERTAELRHKTEQLAEKNKEIIDSITYARRIQQAILPPDRYFHDILPGAFVLYLPKDIVAGDFYWLEQVNGKVLFAAADCTGHGVPGAMVSVVCHNALNRAVREFGIETPSDILDIVARVVEETFEKSEEEVQDGMDISLCAYDPATHILHWAGANNPLWIVTGRTIEGLETQEYTADGHYLYELKPDKQPIGRYAERALFTPHRLQLEKGDMLYLFSDGYIDQFGGEQGKKYKSKHLKQFLLTLQEAPPAAQRERLLAEFHRWKGQLEQVDDVCLIGMRV